MAAIARSIHSSLADGASPLSRRLAQLLPGPAADASQRADMYAQTLCCCLFAARCGAAGPRTLAHAAPGPLAADPILTWLHRSIADPDPAIARDIAELLDLLDHDEIPAVLRAFGRADPLLHFYEVFLAEYDPGLRARRSVFYTPGPVVEYIVRSVDHALRTAFALPDGLADATRRWTIVDPATGTGTFFSAVIRRAHARVPADAWSDHVSTHLLPRLRGCELLLAPYAVAHAKLALQLLATGHRPRATDRLHLFLKDALAGPLALDERDAFTVVLGNPPYSNFDTTPHPWLSGLLEDYKKGLGERKLNLDDAFIKFIRLGQWLIERSGAGVLAFVVSNTFLDGITHRRMRQSLLEFFETIHVLDLHGSGKKSDAGDENVFEVLQGVAIVVMIKPTTPGPRRLWHADLHGSRAHKLDALAGADISQTAWTALEPSAPHFFFVPKDLGLADEYAAFAPLHGGVFLAKNTGIQTKRDRLVYHIERRELEAVLHDMTELPPDQFRAKYDLPPDGRDWTLAAATADVRAGGGRIERVLFHPFDPRWTWYSGRSRGWMAYPRSPLMRSALRPNLLLLTVRNARRGNVDSFLIASTLVDKDAVSPLDNATFFPLYTDTDEPARPHNLAPQFLAALPRPVSAPDALAYIYAILHAPSYRARYAELLRIDYPRIPVTTDRDLFTALVQHGQQLVDLHCMSIKLPPLSSPPDLDDAPIQRPRYQSGHVHLDDRRSFKNVPEVAWTFRVGGQPVLEKWLKERRGRALSPAEVEHFQQVVAILARTAAIMREIDTLIAAHGGWPLA